MQPEQVPSLVINAEDRSRDFMNTKLQVFSNYLNKRLEMEEKEYEELEKKDSTTEALETYSRILMLKSIIEVFKNSIGGEL